MADHPVQCDCRGDVLQEDEEDEAEQEMENQVLDGSGPSDKHVRISGSRFFSVFEITPEGKREKKSKEKKSKQK